MSRLLAAAGFIVLLGGCATKGSVRRVETEIAVLRTTVARQDSARAAELGRIIALQQRILDSLATGRQALRQVRVELGQELLSVQEQLVQVQELTGQSQRRLSEVKRQLDDRAEQLALDTTRAAPAAADTTGAPAVPTPDQLYQTSLRELTRGSVATARVGFQEFARTFPTHTYMPSVLYYLGETFAATSPDSAAFYYRQVTERFPDAQRSPTALYKTGLLAEQRGDRAGARTIYQRVLQQYPRSDEANLARDRLAALRP